MSLIYDEDLRGIRQELKRLDRRICCDDCIEVSETCLDGQVPVYDTATGTWQCGDASGGVTSISESGEAQLTGDVTLSEGDNITLTQVGQDIEISAGDPVTLNADQATQDSANLVGQELQLVPATASTYGVVKLEDTAPTVVANFAALPDPTTVSGKFYWASASQGTKFIGALWGGTYYPAGQYYSNGVSWEYMDTPAQATQPQVDAGVVTNQWVAPSTLAASSQWDTKNDSIQFQDEGVNLGTSGTVDTIDFVGSAVTAARVGNVLTVTVTGSSPAVISPAQITADQDNYSPTDWATATIVRLSFDSSIPAITGFAAKSDGDRVTVFNISGNSGYIPGEHPDSSAANRVISPKDFIILPYSQFELMYDGTSSRWRIIGDDSGGTGVFYSQSAASNVTGDIADVNYLAFNAGLLSQIVSTTTLPTYWSARTGTNNNGAAGVSLVKTVNQYTAFGAAHQFVESDISLPVLSDGTDTFLVEIQLSRVPSLSLVEGDNNIGIRYSDGVNSGKFEGFVQDNAGVEAVVDLGVTVTVDLIYKLRIEFDKSRTESRFYINGVMCGRITGTVPNALTNGSRVVIFKSAGTTERLVKIFNISAGAIYT